MLQTGREIIISIKNIKISVCLFVLNDLTNVNTKESERGFASKSRLIEIINEVKVSTGMKLKI